MFRADGILIPHLSQSRQRYMQAMQLAKLILFHSMFLSGILFLNSCQSDDRSFFDELEPIPISSNYHDTSNRFTEVLSEMIKNGSVCWSEAFTGKKSLQWTRYEWLSKNASDSQLLDLMNNPNTHIRVYAFLSLKDRHHTSLKRVIIAQINDTSSFSWVNGCFGEEKRINSFCLEECSGLFTRKELSKYRNIISKWSDIYVTIPQ